MLSRMEIIYPRTAAEQAMKLTGSVVASHIGEDQVVAGSGAIGISERQMRRWRKRLEDEGPQGLLGSATAEATAGGCC